MPGLEGSVNVPLAGKQSKKFVVGGVLVVGTLVVVYYYRKRKSGSAAAAAADTGQAAPGDTQGASGSGAVSGTDSGGTSSGNPATPGGPPFASNEAWSNWVIQELQALNPSIDTGALINALGVYLHGDEVTQAQKPLVFDALAIAGDPPVAGANGYPPKVKTSPTTNHTTVTVPNVVGDRVENATSALQALGLKPSFETRRPGMAYVVSAQSPTAGHRVHEGSTVHLTIREQAPAQKNPLVGSHKA